MSQDKSRSAGRDYTEINVTEGGKYAGRDFYDYSGGNEGLAEVAGEIQQLLEQLGPTCAINTTTGKMTVATKTIEAISTTLVYQVGYSVLSERVLLKLWLNFSITPLLVLSLMLWKIGEVLKDYD